MTPATTTRRRCRDCRQPLDAAHVWRCPACIAARIDRTKRGTR